MMGSLRRWVPDFIRRSYVLKFGIILLILGLGIGTIGFLATDQIQKEVRKGVNQDLSNLADQEANSFESWTERNELTARTLANSVQEMENSTRMERYITNQLEDDRITPNATSIHVVNLSEKKIVVSTDGYRNRSLGSLPGNRVWIKSVKEQDSIEGTRIIGAGTGMLATPQAVYASQIGDTNKALVYLVELDEYNTGLSREEGTVVYVVDTRQGEDSMSILFDSTGTGNQSGAFFGRYPYPDVISQTRALRNGSYEGGPRVAEAREPTSALRASVPPKFKNSTYIPSYANVQGTPYAVVVHTPESKAMGFVNTVERYGFIATIGGVIVVGLIGAFVGRNTATAIDRLRRKSEKMERGNLDVDFETERIDNIGRLYDGMASMRDALRRQIMEAREAREEAELAREEAEQTSRHLQAKANEYRDVMQAVANEGDLSQRMTPSDRNASMREIAEEFNSMMDEIEFTVDKLKQFANQVATSSEEVTASAQEVRSASKKVTESIQEISDGAERQDDALQSVSREMSGLSTTVEEIASLSNEVADLSQRTAETGRQGREAAQEAIAGMNKIEQESQKAVDQIQRLDEEMDQVDELIEFITDVADQTNMLALNANIEASRAGEGDSGEGFGVVAEEVKDLAAETKEAAEEMEASLQHIQSQAEMAVESVTNTSERISENTESVRNAVEALDEIAGYAEDTNSGVQEISGATQEQAASTQEVVAMVDEAATISEQTTQEAENVAAAAEQQTTAMTEVSDSASALSRQATQLSEALDYFRTGDAEGQVELPSDSELQDIGADDLADEIDAPDGVLDEFGEDDDLDEMERAARDRDLPGPEIDDGDGQSAGIGDLAEQSDGETLGGTDPATFGDIEDGNGDSEEDMFQFPDDEDDA